jgi:hypothetical protein
MAKGNAVSGEDMLYHRHEFYVAPDADAQTRELEERLFALGSDADHETEPFRSSARILWESVVWFVLGLAIYATTWLIATK